MTRGIDEAAVIEPDDAPLTLAECDKSPVANINRKKRRFV
jgi:hypothetical protein